MASPVDDPKSYLTFAEALVGLLIFIFGLGFGWANLKRDIARSSERHDGHDKKFDKQDQEIKEINSKLGELATKDDMRDFKADVIREMYTLFASGPSAPLDRRKEPR